MSLDSGKRMSGRSASNQDLWPRWMWVAVPVLVVVVVAGLWWAIFSPGGREAAKPTLTPTVMITRPQPSQQATQQGTLPAAQGTVTPTLQLLEALPTFTPTQQAVATPTAAPTEVTVSLTVGGKAKVVGTSGTGLNMRAGAGTNQARIKTLPEGAALDVIGGPTDANGFTWWQVRDAAGATGWVVSRYIQPGE